MEFESKLENVSRFTTEIYIFFIFRFKMVAKTIFVTSPKHDNLCLLPKNSAADVNSFNFIFTKRCVSDI